MFAGGIRGCCNTSCNLLGAQVMQSYLPGPSTYQLSGGTGIKCRAARERGQDIISLKVGTAACRICGIRLVLSARGVVRVVVQHTPQPAGTQSSVRSRSVRVPAACQRAT